MCLFQTAPNAILSLRRNKMKKTEEILRPLKRIGGGVHLPHFKNTAESVSAIMPPPEKVVIPMRQHIGAPCEPVVKKGDTVFVGTKIGDTEQFVSAPIHSSVSGTVSELGTVLLPSGEECRTVVIESDGMMTPDPELKPVTVETAEDLVKAAHDCGLVGLGGAGFPTHIKLRKKEGTELDTLVINGAECEPFITSDYREIIEQTENIFEAIYRIKELLGFKQVIICIEDNKPKAIEALYKIAADKRDTDDSIKLMRLKSHYPQGAEKVLIYTATGRRVPAGKLPSDVGCVVMNITSISVLNKYINTGMPLVSKTVTVDGAAVREPQNVVVPIGTSVKDVIEFCDGFKSTPRKILYGGPMMGTALINTDMPILKQNNAIIAMDRRQSEKQKETQCIKCGRCASVCPMKLQPFNIEATLRCSDISELKTLHAEYCIECGCCSYICPAKRNLTQSMRLAKAELRNSK